MNSSVSRVRRAPAALLLLALASFAAPAFARLGGDFASINEDSARVRGQLVSTDLLNYQRHDITTSAGTVIHEYLSRSGKVFAVTWQGPLPPDLRQLFGDYFESFRSAAAAQSHPGGHRQFSIQQSDFVMQASGHLRAFQGRAFVPSLVPSGVTISELP